MAKSGATEILEQHLEKFVLGLCLLLFVAAVVRWGISSPRKFELPGLKGEKISPAEADPKLHARARSVMMQVEAKEPNVPPAPDYAAQFHLLITGSAQGKPPPMAAFGKPGSAIGPVEGPQLEKVDLMELAGVMPPPSKPLVKAVRVLPNRLMGKPSDELVAHVVSIYPYQQLIHAWKDRLRAAGVPCNPAAIGLMVQVQEQLPDGSWGPPRDVTGVYEPITDPQGTPVPPPQVPPYNSTNAGYLARLRDVLSTPAWQAYILQPNYWQVWWPGYGWTDWRVNLPENEITRQAGALFAQTGGIAGTAYVTPQVMGSAVRRRSSEAEEEREEEIRGPTTPTVLLVQIPAPQLPIVPDVAYQIQTGQVLTWFHDNSLEPMKVYRYRLGVKFLNPLLSFDNAVKEPTFAAVPSVTTPFSEWSDPVEVPQPTEFFLTGAVESQGRVTVFTRSTGQQVKERFTIVPGQSVGWVKKIRLTNPANGMVEEVPVDFSTGAIAVGFHVSQAGGRKIAEMLYLDEKGKNLRSKISINSLARSDPEYVRHKELEEKEKVTRLAAEAARAATQPAATPTRPPAAGGD